MADLAALIFPRWNGDRDYILNAVEVTSTEDARHRQVRYRGYSPTDHRTVHVILEERTRG